MHSEDHKHLLWLLNYDPNLEKGSLVKRTAMLSYEPNVNYLADNIICEFRGNWFGTPFKLAGVLDVNSANNIEDILFEYMEMFSTHGKAWHNKVIFMKRYGSDLGDTSYAADNDICTAVIGFVHESNETATEEGWAEPYTRTFGTDKVRDLPGWFVKGYLTDAKRYGESILFTTLPGKDKIGLAVHNKDATLLKFYMPVYQWTHWDISKLIDAETGNNYLSGLAGGPILDNTENKLWKVRKPLQDLSLDKAEIIVPGDTIKHNEEFQLADFKTRDQGSPTKPFQLGLFLTSMFGSTSNSIPFNHSSYLHYFKKFKAFDNNVAIEDKPNHETKIVPKIISIERIKTNQFSYDYELLLNNDPVLIARRDWNENWSHDENIKADDVAWLEQSVNVLGLDRSLEVLTPRNAYWNDNGTIKTGSKSKIGGEPYNGTPIIHCATHVLPDYVSAKLPRTWFKGEKIPLVLTTITDKGEVVILKDIFEIDYNQQDYNLKHLTDNPFADPGEPRHFDTYMLDEDRKSHHTRLAKELDLVTSDNWYIGYCNLNHEKFSDIDKKFPIGLLEGTMPYETRKDEEFSHTSYIWRYQKVEDSGNIIGYYPMLTFFIRITEEGKALCLEHKVQSLRLYVSEPDANESLLHSVMNGANLTKPSFPLYNVPAVTNLNNNEDLSKFRLVKEFVLDQNVKDYDAEKYNYDTGSSRTSGWANDGTGLNEDVISVPINKYGAAQNLPQFYGLKGQVIPVPDGISHWTPDFILHDYAWQGEPLNLEYSGDVWEGQGAKHLAVIKSLVFLGGCIDKEGKEEIGNVRWCGIQKGRSMIDIFPKENFIGVGHEPITALIEFREQLLVFNRHNFYRIAMHNIFDPTTWEFLEAEYGQGCLSRKLIANTPYGIAYCSDNGIYITDGSKPMCLSDNPSKELNIDSLYKRVIFNSTYIFTEYNDIGSFKLDLNDDSLLEFNERAELYYSKETDELILTSPVALKGYQPASGYAKFNYQYKIIYSFSDKNWRVEGFDHYFYDNAVGYIKTQPWALKGRLNGMLQNVVVPIIPDYYQMTNGGGFEKPTDIALSFLQKNSSSYIQDQITILYNTMETEYSAQIWAEFITHELGDGISDSLLRKIILSCTPQTYPNILVGGWLDYEYSQDTNSAAHDPQISIAKRSLDYVGQGTLNDSWIDLIPKNMLAKGGGNPWKSLMQTPGGIVKDQDELLHGNESLVILAPIKTLFRSSRYKLRSNVIAKVNAMIFDLITFGRRSQ